MADDGGPAFPEPCTQEWRGKEFQFTPGMSLRDWFAGMAMQGMLASEVGGEGLCPNMKKGMTFAAGVAHESCKYADALIA